MLTLSDILAARDRIATTAVRSRIVRLSRARVRVAGFPEISDSMPEVYLKDESEQPVRSFKQRGSYNRIALLAQEDPAAFARGVITYSSGNHAQGVAYAARALGTKAVIVMPSNAPATKRAATLALGAEVVEVGPASTERKQRAQELASAHGYTIIEPYDDPAIIAGQGTCGLEILEQMGWLEPAAQQMLHPPSDSLVLSPVSGGGLLSGVSTAIKLTCAAHNIVPPRVFGCEPELAGDAAESFRTRTLTEWPAAHTTRTLCDGLRTQSLGKLNFDHILAHTDGIVTLSEDEIRTANRILLTATDIVAEPSGAVTLAAALFRRDQLPAAEKIVAIVSGGNIDDAVKAEILAPVVGL